MKLKLVWIPISCLLILVVFFTVITIINSNSQDDSAEIEKPLPTARIVYKSIVTDVDNFPQSNTSETPTELSDMFRGVFHIVPNDQNADWSILLIARRQKENVAFSITIIHDTFVMNHLAMGAENLNSALLLFLDIINQRLMGNTNMEVSDTMPTIILN